MNTKRTCSCPHRSPCPLSTGKFVGTRIHTIYKHLCRRTKSENHPQFANYGGRGVKSLWPSFGMFMIDMGKSYLEHVAKHGERDTTIDRIDNNGPYSKKNCRWATRREQNRNRRNNLYLDFRGERKLLCEWAEELGLNYATIISRIHLYGWSVEDALTRPVRKLSLPSRKIG